MQTNFCTFVWILIRNDLNIQPIPMCHISNDREHISDQIYNWYLWVEIMSFFQVPTTICNNNDDFNVHAWQVYSFWSLLSLCSVCHPHSCLNCAPAVNADPCTTAPVSTVLPHATSTCSVPIVWSSPVAAGAALITGMEPVSVWMGDCTHRSMGRVQRLMSAWNISLMYQVSWRRFSGHW